MEYKITKHTMQLSNEVAKKFMQMLRWAYKVNAVSMHISLLRVHSHLHL